MHTDKILLTLAALACFALLACTTAKPLSTSDALSGSGWTLNSLQGQAPLPGPSITANFENGKVYGNDGCNQYHTAYTLNADKLSFAKNMATTMMACPEPVMRQASTYASLLMKTASYQIDGAQLVLLDTNHKSLATFSKQSADLAGTSWQVTGSNNGKQAVVSVVKDTTLTLNFGTDGRLSGSAGCNNYTAAYTASGKSLKIEMPASTRKLCAAPVGVMEQEAQFLKALATVATYQLDGKRLQLRTATDALAVSLVLSF
ncbi:MAG: META domain-containing protein [Methylococcales bacterium]|nr:META domain-containing protein [Methylococcales bacterium]